MVMHKPLHPGLILKDMLIDNVGLSITEAAEKLGVTRTTLSRLLNGHASLSPEMALRLSMLLETSIDVWVNLQAHFDVWKIQQQSNDIHVDPLDDVA